MEGIIIDPRAGTVTVPWAGALRPPFATSLYSYFLLVNYVLLCSLKKLSSTEYKYIELCYLSLYIILLETFNKESDKILGDRIRTY